MQARRNQPITYVQMPQFGLAYGDLYRALILTHRGHGQIEYQGVHITDHPHAEFVCTHREGGGHYATGDNCCNCEAGAHGRTCRHQLAVRYSGTVKNIKRAFALWKEIN